MSAPIATPEKNAVTNAAPPSPLGNGGRDVIPIPLMIGIFTAVLALVLSLMADSWKVEWNRYLSLKAQSTQKHKEAIAPLLWLTARGENSPTYLSELGHCFLITGDYDNALKWLLLAQKYRANVPADDQGNAREIADFSTYIGRVYFAKGDYTEAEKYLQAGLKHNKVDRYANFYLGEIEMGRKNFVKAADYFKVVARDPAFEKQVKGHYAEIEQKLFASVDQAVSSK